jgi:phage terminase large subunit GpA-like protein
MELDVAGEGDPVSLSEARTATYVDAKTVICSSPTIEGISPIWNLYAGGTMHRWTWPCPECHEYFAPELSLLWWPDKSSPAHAKRTARLTCPRCGGQLEDKFRGAMNGAGKYEATGDPDSDCASFWVSGLASPWKSWGEVAKLVIEAERSREPGKIKAVRNTILGELYKFEGDAPLAEEVKSLRSGYRSDELPAGVLALTAGADVQKASIYYVIRGWGEGATSWLIRHEQLFGDTDQPEIWQEFAERLSGSWGDADRRIEIFGTFVDSGYRPSPVYDFCLRSPRVRPCKGHDKLPVPVKQSTADPKQGIRVQHLDTGYFKAFCTRASARLLASAAHSICLSMPRTCTAKCWCRSPR